MSGLDSDGVDVREHNICSATSKAGLFRVFTKSPPEAVCGAEFKD